MKSDNRHEFLFLAHFLSSEFIQDPEDQRTLEEVVADFCSTNSKEAISGVRANIDEFFRKHDNDLDDAFARIFQPQVDPRGYGMSTADWLRKLKELLARQ